ncbi:hypothetical protein [Ponticaulis profundi]|uniref:DUF4282 domain-containing protein n=1 Tax=Ponticaulis profundi TaxID=2665222 RepID=A0ABW1SAZ1_9PROT|tara:strand:- start:80 stop:358 length:279 start_codon:yes stop_codon:yes gene_type:complete
MKFFVINSFRLMVYIVYPAFIIYAGATGYINGELIAERTSVEFLRQPIAAGAFGLFLGWVMATLVAGLIVTLLDIRDDVNDLLKIAEEQEDA